MVEISFEEIKTLQKENEELKKTTNKLSTNQLMFTVPQSAVILGWNSRRLWDLVHEHRDAILNASCLNDLCSGQCKNGIPSVRIGKRYFITKEALELFVRNQRKNSFKEVHEII